MKKLILIFYLIFGLIFIISPTIINAQDWSMFHHDLRHTGYTVSRAPLTGILSWDYTIPGQYSLWSSPTVDNGKVFVGSYDRNVYALNETNGSLVWSSNIGDSIDLSSAAIANGRVFVGSIAANSKVYALNETNGNIIWNYSTGAYIWSSPAVHDGKIFIGCNNGNLYALDETNGSLVWSYPVDGIVQSSPAVADGIVFVGSRNNTDSKIVALNETTGSLIWNYTTGKTVTSSPSVLDEMLFVGTSGSPGYAYALNQTTGSQIWNYSTGSVESSPAVAYGKVYVGTGMGCWCIIALNKTTGSLIWSFPTGDLVQSSPAVADGIVFVGSRNNKTYALNESTGSLIWNYTADDSIFASPAISHGMVFISTIRGHIYAFGNYTVGCLDNDFDGFYGYHALLCPGGNDCDDNDNTVYPGAPELCDGKDNDCDLIIPVNESDADNDGFMICKGDCNDNNPSLNMWIAHQCLNINCTPVIFNGNVSDKIDVVFVGSNFPSYTSLNQTILELVDYAGTSNGLMSVQPFSQNKTKFNFWLVNTTQTFTNNNFRTSSTTLVNSTCPFVDEKIVLFITPRIWDNADIWGYYNWTTTEWVWSDAGGFGMYVTVGTQFLTDTGWPLQADFDTQGNAYAVPQNLSFNKNQVKMQFTHEFGHSFGGLFDEYNAYNCNSNTTCNPRIRNPPQVANCALTPCNKWSTVTAYCNAPCGYSDWCRSTANSLMRSIPATPPATFNQVSINELRKDMINYTTGTSNITIGVPSPSPQSSYVLPLTYSGGTFTPGVLTIVPTAAPGGSSQPSAGYSVNVVSSNATLYSMRMGITAVSSAPSPEWFDEFGNQIYFPNDSLYIPEPHETILVLPKFPDAEKINMYDPEGQLVFEVYVGEAEIPNVTIISPEEKNYAMEKLWLKVTADIPVDTWEYELNGGERVSFTPNITIDVDQCANELIVYASSGEQEGFSFVQFNALTGDVDGDRGVDIFDIVLCAGAYGTTPIDPKWKPECDINPAPDGNGKIDIFDIVTMAGKYGETCINTCSSNLDCLFMGEFSSYCEKEIGDCYGEGTCEQRPLYCVYWWDPVCGCNGFTFGNACEAALHGFSIDHYGEC